MGQENNDGQQTCGLQPTQVNVSDIICNIPDLSQPFKFAEWKLYHFPEHNNQCLPGNLEPDPDPYNSGRPQDSLQRLRYKWVYSFIEWSNGSIEWYGEYYVDGNERIGSVDLTNAKNLERNRRPHQFSNISTSIRLPYSIEGQRVYYYFYVSRIRLPLDTLGQLQDVHIRDMLPMIDLADISQACVFINNEWNLRITDPITIAINMNRKYQRSLDAQLGYVTVYEGQPVEQRTITEERQKKKLLGELLKSVRDGDPEDELDLIDEFGPGKGREMRNFLRDYRNTLNRKIRTKDQASADLCYWMRGELMGIAEISYKTFENEDFYQYIKSYAQCVNRLQESGPGKAYLAHIIGENNHFIHKYVLLESAAPEDVFQVCSACFSAIVSIMTDIVPLYIKIRGLITATILVHSIQFISRLELLVVDVTSHSLKVRRVQQFVSLHVEIQTIRINPAINNDRLTPWLHNVEEVNSVLEGLGVLLEVANLGLAIKTFIEADSALGTIQAILGLIGSLVNTTISVFSIILELTQRTIAKFGIFTAVIDIICSTIDAVSMARRSDYSAMVGFGIAATGSLIVAFGCAVTIWGCGISATILGFPAGMVLTVIGGIVIAIGSIIAVFTRDSDIELFISHCLWGRYYGNDHVGGEGDLQWTGGPFRDWRNNLDKQIIALLNILSAFTLESKGSSKVKIILE